jgi:hypothetical protein
VARRADATLGLGERLATALELIERRAGGALASLQIADALGAAGVADTRRAFPIFARGGAARREALRSGGWAFVALAVGLAFAFWPAAGSAVTPGAGRDALALADPGSQEDELAPRLLQTADGDQTGEAVRARTERPEDIGEAPGLLGQAENQAPGQAAQAAQTAADQAQQGAAGQQNPNVAERQAALQDLGDALRQTQTGKQAGEALRSGDTQRASQQLSQLADQVRNLSPGERQALAQSFQQAAGRIGEKDRVLGDAARRAADALGQFRNQEAEQAIRDAANQVRQTGEQAEAQRALQDRQQQIQSGGQPQMPQMPGADRQPGSPDSSRSANQQAGRPDAGAAGSASSVDLAQLEGELRGGGLESGSSGTGTGAGTGAGADIKGPPTRLNVEARTITVQAEEREGPTQWRPPSPNAPPSAPPPAAALPGGPASAAPVGSGLDINSVPLDLADPVRQYFTPEQPKP